MTTDGEPIRVFVVDDHPLVRMGLREALARSGVQSAGEAASAAEAMAKILPSKPDVVIIDIELPDGNGIDVCAALVPQDPTIKYVVLSAFTSEELALAAIQAGAMGCLLKDISSADLVAGLRAVASGGALFGASVAGHLLNRIQSGEAPVDPRIADLTVREREILRLLGQGRSNREIARTLYLADKTVRNYVSGMLQKLGMSQRTEAALLAAELQGFTARRIAPRSD